MANSITTSCDPATSMPKSKQSKSKKIQSFWSKNTNEIDRIGWSRRYALSDSDDSDEESDSESSSNQNCNGNDNSEDSSKNDSGQDNSNANKKECSNKNSISITTVIGQEPSSHQRATKERECNCHHVLKCLLDTHAPDLRQQILLKVHNWLNGGEHICSSLSASAFASSSASARNDNGSGNASGNGSVDRVVLTEQQSNDYYHLVNPQDYSTEVNWVGDAQISDNEETTTVDTCPNHDEEWEDIGVDVLDVEASATVEWIATLAFVMLGQLIVVYITSWIGS